MPAAWLLLYCRILSACGGRRRRRRRARARAAARAPCISHRSSQAPYSLLLLHPLAPRRYGAAAQHAALATAYTQAAAARHSAATLAIGHSARHCAMAAEPEDESRQPLNYTPLPNGYRALVLGSTGAIGRELVAQVRVVCVHRRRARCRGGTVWPAACSHTQPTARMWRLGGGWWLASGDWRDCAIMGTHALCVETAAFACLRAILLAYLFFFCFLLLVLVFFLAVLAVWRNCSAVPRRARAAAAAAAAAPLPFAWFEWCVLRV
jgi:hypothetical protein